MAMFWPVTFATPSGDKLYYLRDDAPQAFRTDGVNVRISAADFPGSDETEAEDWGQDGEGPYRDVILRRTPLGWVEEDITE